MSDQKTKIITDLMAINERNSALYESIISFLHTYPEEEFPNLYSDLADDIYQNKMDIESHILKLSSK